MQNMKPKKDGSRKAKKNGTSEPKERQGRKQAIEVKKNPRGGKRKGGAQKKPKKKKKKKKQKNPPMGGRKSNSPRIGVITALNGLPETGK